jgi:CRISPR-associated endonuclease/helicase Cas3
MAASFAGAFDATECGRLTGLWHDLGKYAPDWQQFLLAAGQDAAELNDGGGDSSVRARRRGPDHSTAGAIQAAQTFGEQSRIGLALAFAIAAHHAGLADKTELRSRIRADDKRRRFESCLAQAAPEVLAATAVELPSFLRSQAQRECIERRFETFVRMLFSALVDADRLATEAYVQGVGVGSSGADERRRWRPLDDYLDPLESHLAGLEKRAWTTVNQVRRRVLSWCRESASGPQGAYSLTVPTGGGKTLSSLAFALRHAQVHRLRRVIVALPFISILDQTADVYRSVFRPALGTDVLVEHHSNLQPERATRPNNLASENWDAPVVVTTQVQLFESLFSNRPRDCRKLHSLARSVLILDEVQTLPVGLLAPILDQLRELYTNYGTTLLLTTATQPALHRRKLGPYVFDGLDPTPTEIVPANAMDDLFATLDRVDVHWPDAGSSTSCGDLAQVLLGAKQILVSSHHLWTFS